MTDIYDLARPIRDAALAEIERLMGGADVCPNARDANRLGVQLSAVLLAFAADRHQQTGGLIRDDGLRFVLTAAIATQIANAAMAFRPAFNGKPVPPTMAAHAMLHDICARTLQQIAINEQGLADFVIPFQRNEGGELEVKPFDYNEMLKGKP
jgi:hypothetical protein